MLLSDTEIKAKNLIEDGIDSHYRAISYDLGIGKIITTNGDEPEFLLLQPQGIVEVVSREKIRLPHDVVAYAMVKTSLCNEGILPLNIGIVDPGYEGYLSATLLNFGKKEYTLLPDEVFLRLTFHKCSASTRKDWPNPISHEEYIRDKKKKVVNFAQTFLNLDSTVKQATERFIENLKNKALFYLPLFAAMLAIFAFLVTIGVNFTNRGYWSKDDVKAEIKQELGLTKEGDLETRIKDLENQLERLKASQH